MINLKRYLGILTHANCKLFEPTNSKVTNVTTSNHLVKVMGVKVKKTQFSEKCFSQHDQF